MKGNQNQNKRDKTQLWANGKKENVESAANSLQEMCANVLRKYKPDKGARNSSDCGWGMSESKQVLD